MKNYQQLHDNQLGKMVQHLRSLKFLSSLNDKVIFSKKPYKIGFYSVFAYKMSLDFLSKIIFLLIEISKSLANYF